MRVPLDEVPDAADGASADPEPALVGHTDDRIIVYCDTGVRSLLAANELKKLGFSNVASMAGGIKGWASSGYPVEK